MRSTAAPRTPSALIEETGTLDDARKQALRETLRQYVQTLPRPHRAKASGQP